MFGKTSPSGQFREAKNKDIKNYFDSNTEPKYMSYGSKSGFNLQYEGPNLRNDD